MDAVADVCAAEPLTMLVDNAGVAHCVPLAELPAAKAREPVHVKVAAPTMLTRAAVPGMLARGAGAAGRATPRGASRVRRRTGVPVPAG